jgi:hypothetical protein
MVRKYYHRSIAERYNQKSHRIFIALFHEWSGPSLYEHSNHFDFRNFKINKAPLIRVHKSKGVNIIFWEFR